MSADMYRSQLMRKRDQRVDAEKKVGEYRIKETGKRNDAAKARAAASKASNTSTAQSKAREAARHDDAAASAGNDANRWQQTASRYAKEESDLAGRLARAEQSEAAAIETRRKREQDRTRRLEDAARREHERAMRNAAVTSGAMERRLTSVEHLTTSVLRELRAPKVEKLRILLLGASSEGDLRVGREQKRIREAVQSALHRDYVEFDVRPAATTDDLLDGIIRFRPHIVHFSGHSGVDLLIFEDDIDGHHPGRTVPAQAFADAVAATDFPPLVVFLNSCHSAVQAHALVATVVPFAVGMADAVDDSSAIAYASRFYSTIADGHSILSADRAARATLNLLGLTGAELPVLACAPEIDPSQAVLVQPSPQAANS